MIKHVVMWTVKETDGHSKEENSRLLKEKLMHLPSVISEIKEFDVGINSAESAASYDVVLISTFETWDDLAMYQVHPEHLNVVEFVKKVRVDRAVVDYEF